MFTVTFFMTHTECASVAHHLCNSSEIELQEIQSLVLLSYTKQAAKQACKQLTKTLGSKRPAVD